MRAYNIYNILKTVRHFITPFDTRAKLQNVHVIIVFQVIEIKKDDDMFHYTIVIHFYELHEIILRIPTHSFYS